MRVLVRHWDFTATPYEVHVGETALELVGIKGRVSLPYTKLMDFCVTINRRGQSSFTAIYDGKMYEGEIFDPNEITAFATALHNKLGSFINIEIRKH